MEFPAGIVIVWHGMACIMKMSMEISYRTSTNTDNNNAAAAAAIMLWAIQHDCGVYSSISVLRAAIITNDVFFTWFLRFSKP